MSQVEVTKTINVPASAAWERISGFRGIEEFSPIARSVVEGNGVGSTRTCYMPDDAVINEVLNKVDEDQMQIEYAIVSGPFPITDYVSTVKIKSTSDDSCEITWSANYIVEDAHQEDMKNLFGGFYNVIIESLETLINSKN